MTTACRADNCAAQSITWPSKARPPNRCNTLGNVLFIRVPLPAAMMTTSIWVAMLFPVNFLRLGSGLKNRLAALILPATRYRFRIISVLGLAALLSACSAVKIGYNQAPALVYWYLDGYADFTDAQSLQLKADLNRLQAWHRQTQLPAYADLLHKLQPLMLASITPAQACTVVLDVRSKLTTVSGQSEPALAALVVSLQPDQLLHMQRKFSRGNADYRKEFIDAPPAAIRTKRYEQAVSRAEMLYGPLESQQLRRIGQLVDQSGFNAALAYAERLRRQQDTLQTLRTLTPGNAAAARVELRALIERSMESPDTAYRAYFEKITLQGCRAIAELHDTTSPAQRQKALRVLKGYEQDFRALASQSIAQALE